MTTDELRLQLIEAYLRDGFESQRVQALKTELYQQGATWLDVVEVFVAAHLYGSLDNFYRKHPQPRS